MTASDRVSDYFEEIMGRPMTREEKIPLSAIITGDLDEDWPDVYADAGTKEDLEILLKTPPVETPFLTRIKA